MWMKIRQKVKSIFDSNGVQPISSCHGETTQFKHFKWDVFKIDLTQSNVQKIPFENSTSNQGFDWIISFKNCSTKNFCPNTH
jgi:hypothetical protein